MLFTKGMLLFEKSTGRTLRVLDELGPTADPKGVPTQVVLIDINHKHAEPEFIGKVKLQTGIAGEPGKDKEYVRVEEAQIVINLANLGPGEKAHIARRWKVATYLTEFGIDLYFPKRRAEIVAQAVIAKLGSRPFIYRVLRLGLQRGGGEQAYVTDYPISARKGIPRVPAENAPKPGRPRTISPGKGLSRTQIQRTNIRKALAHSPVGADGRNLRSAYDHMRIHYYPEYVELEPGSRGTIKTTDPDRVPSFEQFRTQWKTEQTFEERQLNRLRERAYKLKFGSHLSGTLQEVRGPGTRFYIDATVLDVYGISRLNRNRIVGRATLYLVVDEFSRMIVGIYVGLEPPCWQGAMLALWNCNIPKVDFCKTYGIDIPEWLWPTGYMPVHLMGDRGELTSDEAERLAKGFRFDVENAPPYAGEAKAVAERTFGVVQTKFGPWLPGYVDPEFSGRGEPRAPLKAAMDIIQITRAMIYAVLWANTRVVREYEGEVDVVTSNTPFVPVELWRWGAENLKCDSRRFHKSYLESYLLPRQTVKLGQKAVKFARGLYFMGVELQHSDWFLEAVHRKKEPTVVYHPLDMSTIHLVPEEERAGLYDISLTRRCKRFTGFAHGEIMALAKQAAITNKKAEYELEPVRLGFEQKIQETVADGKRQTREQWDPSVSNNSRLKDIKQNKADELAHMAAEALAHPNLAGANDIPDVSSVEDTADRKALEEVAEMIARRQAKTPPKEE